MAIDYIKEAEKYRPEVIKILLVGEAPPPKGKTYFYLPKELKNNASIQDFRNDRSLPATIFCHYFGKTPEGIKEYIQFLNQLKNMGVFLVDIHDEPIKVRGSTEGEQKIIDSIPKLYKKLQKRQINMEAQKTIFLLARNSYAKHIRKQYPYAECFPWVKFRMVTLERTP